MEVGIGTFCTDKLFSPSLPLLTSSVIDLTKKLIDIGIGISRNKHFVPTVTDLL